MPARPWRVSGICAPCRRMQSTCRGRCVRGSLVFVRAQGTSSTAPRATGPAPSKSTATASAPTMRLAGTRSLAIPKSAFAFPPWCLNFWPSACSTRGQGRGARKTRHRLEVSTSSSASFPLCAPRWSWLYWQEWRWCVTTDIVDVLQPSPWIYTSGAAALPARTMGSARSI